jgi:putative CocE/NonD family hydrolase
VIVTEFPRAVREIENIFIPLKDGTQLAARLWLPADAEQDPVPALLEYLPYRKRDGTVERDSQTHPYLAGHGYACVRVDIRGSGESDGLLTDEYTAQEQDDAVEVIAWLAAQPWCSGAVGMFGISWGGFNALQVAARRPPALKAIVTICSTDDRYRDDVHYMGGAKLTSGFGWAGFLFGAMCRPPDPKLVGERWREMWIERLKNVPLFLERWLQHQRRDDYWRHGSVCEDYAAIECPVYAVGGWTDGYTNAIPRLLEHLKVPRKGLIGPWAHAYPHFALPGPQIGFLQEMLRWWDHWLKGQDTGVMNEPMLRAWMSDSVMPADHHETLPGRWVAEPTWPPGREPQRLYLTGRGLVLERRPLSPRAICSPQTLGTRSGEWCPFGRGHDMAGDQQDDDEVSAIFDTPDLQESVEILGAPVVTLHLSCDKPVAMVVARLCDVHQTEEDGNPTEESSRVSFGVLNLTHRDSHEAPSPLVPGRQYVVRFQLNDTGASFPAGHRIRLALSTAYWPMVWPSPSKATVTIYGGSLELPVRPPQPADAALPPLPAPETAPPERPTPIRPGVMRFDRLGLELGTEWQFDFHLLLNDPTRAVAQMHRTDTISRETWQVRTETFMQWSCTGNFFHLRASLGAWEGEQEVCQREWRCAIPRDLI